MDDITTILTETDVREIDCENNIIKTEVITITVHCRDGPKHMGVPGTEIL
jgi:hypothetical protein